MEPLRLASRWKRIICALVVGGAAILPVLDLAHSSVDLSWLGPALGVVLLPGAAVAIIASGNFHIFSLFVMGLGQFAFYSAVAYLLLTALAKREAKIRERTTSDG
jgi:hypothetical protein